MPVWPISGLVLNTDFENNGAFHLVVWQGITVITYTGVVKFL